MAETDQVTETGPSVLAQLPPAARQILLLVGLAGAVAAGVSLVLWTKSPTLTPLYSDLAERDAAAVVTLLEGADVPYRLDATTGAVMVPANRRYELRMQMAAAGLPRGGGFGIDEIPERSGFGSSPFMENALYTHAIETELARTIATMQPVDTARVHIAASRQSAFISQQRQPSASVLLTLFPGRRLEEQQVQSVVHLVASAIPELSTERVTVVDQSGGLLTRPQGDESAQLTTSQFEYTQQLEEAYAERIEALLTPVVGAGRVRATVAAELDFTVSEETRESFDPQIAVVRSETTSEESRTGNSLAQGIPGALSNQPPEVEPAAEVAEEPSPEPVSTSRSATRNFEIDKTISHTKQAVGAIQRLSIGVLIDHRPSGSGRGPGEPLAQEELDSLTELVQQAVGFDAARGDTISVVNSAFQPPPTMQPPDPLALWEQPMVWDLARQVLGAALVLVLAFVIVRPIMTSLTRPQPALPMPMGAQGGRQAGYGTPHALPGGMQALPAGYDERMTAARSVAGQDPQQVAQVVRSWVAEDNG
jgi:flagellar M-ring protein FliF